jgi:hypothetical protein
MAKEETTVAAEKTPATATTTTEVTIPDGSTAPKDPATTGATETTTSESEDAVTKTTVAKTPATTKLVEKKVVTEPAVDVVQTVMDKWVAPSVEKVDTSGFSATKLSRFTAHRNNRMIEADALLDVSAEDAFHISEDGLLGDLDDFGQPETRNKVEINDFDALFADIEASDMSVSEKGRSKRAANVVKKIQDQGMRVVRTASGRHWVESTVDGKREYSAMAILEINDMLSKFVNPNAPVTPGVTPDDKEPKIPGLKKLLVPEAEDPLDFKAYDWLQVAALGTDFVTTLTAIAGKSTGIGAVPGAIVGVAGDVTALALGLTSDIMNPNVSGWEATQNAGIRFGLGAVEAFTIAPASLSATLRK